MSSSADRFTPAQPSQEVTSADAVAMSLPLAGPTSRMLAYLVDWSCVSLLLLFLLLILALGGAGLEWIGEEFRERVPIPDDPDDQEQLRRFGAAVIGLWLVVATFGEVLWFVFWEAVSGGSSPGKRLVGLRVMRDGGRPLTLSASLVRNLLRVVDVLPAYYLTGLVSMLVSNDAKRLGDLAAGSVVVRLDRPTAARPLAVDDDPDAARFSFRRDQIERLGHAEAALVRQTLRRHESLTPEQADEALARAVEVLSAKLGIEDEVATTDRVAFLEALWRARVR